MWYNIRIQSNSSMKFFLLFGYLCMISAIPLHRDVNALGNDGWTPLQRSMFVGVDKKIHYPPHIEWFSQRWVGKFKQDNVDT